jgi:hypothetical protein
MTWAAGVLVVLFLLLCILNPSLFLSMLGEVVETLVEHVI